MFYSEKELVIALISMLEEKKLKIENIKDFLILEEIEGMIGRPDILLKSRNGKKIITIEVKLKNWKRALQQAYKYRSFSDIAFICMDEKNIKPAIANMQMFIKSNIGLISINEKNEVKIHYEPTLKKAYVKALRDIAESKFIEQYG
ncbi:MAG: hypothetical protein PHX04_05015 [Bacilli bacterium]|nr:hypothetical protein [Bacilli bacterium]